MQLRNLFLLCFLFLARNGSVAQNISLAGTVTIQNSSYETGRKVPVSGASIRAPLAKAASSDGNGAFALRFSGLPAGSSIRVSVEKHGLELVNRADLDAAVLGGTVLEIIMADPAKLAEVQERFYRVSSEQVLRTFEERARALQDDGVALSERIGKVNALLLDSITTLGEAQEALSLQREAALERINELSRTLAMVDLDRSNERYRAAYAAMQRGAVDSVLAILDTDGLRHDLTATRSQRETGTDLVGQANVAIRQVFSAYRLKSDVHRLSLDLGAAMAVLSRMDTIQRTEADAFSIMDRALFLRELGRMQMRLARLPEATMSLDSSWHLLQRTFGEDHPETVQGLLEMAVLREEEGRPEDAMALYREALDRRLASENIDRSILIEPLAGIGNVLSSMGAYDSAMTYTERALDLVQETGRSGTMEEATLTNSLGYRLDYLGRYKEAFDVYQRSLKQRKQLIADGVKGVDLTVVYGNLGYVCDELGDYPMALQYHDSCLVLEERLYGRRHTAPAGTINNIGRVRSRMGDDEGALVNYREAMGIQLELLGPDHFSVGISHNNIASKLDDLGRKQEALPHYEEALRIFTEELGPDHPYVAQVLSNKASSLGERGAHDEALAAYRESLRIRTLVYGAEHDAIAETLAGIGVQWTHLGNADSALTYLRRARSIQEAVLGAEHVAIGYTEENLGNAMLLTKDTVAARVHFERSIAIGEKADGKSHRSLAPRYASLAMCFLASNEGEQASSYALHALVIAPNLHATWILYRTSRDDRDALARLIEGMGMMGTKADEGRVGHDELKRVFRARAKAAGREDLLRKYGL